MEKIHTVLFSLSDKREYTSEEFKALQKRTGKNETTLIKEYNLVRVAKLIVYGSLRYRDAAYSRFKENYLLPRPVPVTLEGYHVIQPPSIQYRALEPYPNALVDAELFYIFPESIPLFDTYESVSTGLYKRVMYKDAYLYVKGDTYPEA